VDELYLLLGTTSLQVQAALATGTAERVRFLHGLPVWRAFWTELVQLKERVGQLDHLSAADESAIRQSILASVDRASSGPRDAPAHPAALIASDVADERRLPTPPPDDPSYGTGSVRSASAATSSQVPLDMAKATATPQPPKRAPAAEEASLAVSAAEALASSASAAARYAMAEVSARKALAMTPGTAESAARASPPPAGSTSPPPTRQTSAPNRTAISTSTLAPNDSTPTASSYGERASQAQANLARELAAHRHQFVASTPRSQSAAAWQTGGTPSGESMFVPGLGADVAPRRMERHRALDRHSSPGREGVIVVRIVTGSTLDRSGVSVGDCLLTVDGGAIVDGEHLAEVIESLPPEHCPQITVMPHARATKTPLTVHLAPAE
jgi:hypothetical protein